MDGTILLHADYVAMYIRSLDDRQKVGSRYIGLVLIATHEEECKKDKHKYVVKKLA